MEGATIGEPRRRGRVLLLNAELRTTQGAPALARLGAELECAGFEVLASPDLQGALQLLKSHAHAEERFRLVIASQAQPSTVRALRAACASYPVPVVVTSPSPELCLAAGALMASEDIFAMDDLQPLLGTEAPHPFGAVDPAHPSRCGPVTSLLRRFMRVQIDSDDHDVASRWPRAEPRPLLDWLSSPAALTSAHTDAGDPAPRSGLDSAPLQRVLQIFCQVLAMVDGAHAQGHRLSSVRPSLLLVDGLGHVSLAAAASGAGPAGVEGVSSATGLGTANGTTNRDGPTAHARGKEAYTAPAHARAPSLESREASSGILSVPEAGDAVMAEASAIVPQGPGLQGVVVNAQGPGIAMRPPALRGANSRDRGDALYASPEESASGAPPTLASDVFSLGMLLLDLLWHAGHAGGRGAARPGAPPRLGRLAFLAEARDRAVDPWVLEEHPREASLALTMLHPVPERRPATADLLRSPVLLESLASLLDGVAGKGLGDLACEFESFATFLSELRQRRIAARHSCRARVGALRADIRRVKAAIAALSGGALRTPSRPRLVSMPPAPGRDALPALADDCEGAEGTGSDAMGIEGVSPAAYEPRTSFGAAEAVAGADDDDGRSESSHTAKRRRWAGQQGQQGSQGRVRPLARGLSSTAFAEWADGTGDEGPAPLPVEDEVRATVARRWEVLRHVAAQLEGTVLPRVRGAEGVAVGARASEGSGAGPAQGSGVVCRNHGPRQSWAAGEWMPGAGDAGAGVGAGDADRLLAVGSDLLRFTATSGLRVRATVNHGDVMAMHSMVCSIACDRDHEFFATAGTSRRVKIFDLSTVLDPGTFIHYPTAELVSRSKLSSVAWNAYIKGQIASANYEGAVQLHSAATQREIAMFEEHGRRVWSLDFCVPDPTLLASGSDDATVKIWSIREPASVATLSLGSNVCAVRFAPTSAHLLAAGTAGTAAFLYDLRHAARPLAVLEGHQRAVSYVSFTGAGEVVTASVDSTLKLWDISGPVRASGDGAEHETASTQRVAAQSTYRGHANRGNFVGLATTSNGLLFTGSEDNCVYTYHKAMPVPISRHEIASVGHEADGQPAKAFVSALAWSERRELLFAANSVGAVQVLQTV